jgi:hypothetical protein
MPRNTSFDDEIQQVTPMEYVNYFDDTTCPF